MKRYFLLLLAVLAFSSCGRCYDLLVGTFGENLYSYTFRPLSRNSFEKRWSAAMKDPSYLAIGQEGEILAPSHLGKGSYICSFRDSVRTGLVSEIGRGPAHVWAFEGTPFCVTAEYAGGTLSVFRSEDGAVRERVQSIVYEGCGPDERRQKSPHPHQCKEIPASICRAEGIEGRWALVCDLGLDTVHVLSFDPLAAEPLCDRPGLSIPTGPATGPRHIAFDEARGILHVLTELSNELISWRISSDPAGLPVFTEIGRYLVAEAGEKGSGDVHISPDGRFIYTTHRCGNDGIATFSIGEDGVPQFVSYANCGEHPRNFCITSDGRYVLIGCKNDRHIEVWKRNLRDGSLRNTGDYLDFGNEEPVCIIEY